MTPQDLHRPPARKEVTGQSPDLNAQSAGDKQTRAIRVAGPKGLGSRKGAAGLWEKERKRTGRVPAFKARQWRRRLCP